MKFTKRTLEAIEATGKRQVFFDDAFTGFALRVSENGRKSFYYSYRPGKGRGAEKKWLMLGTFPTVTCEQARELAKQKAAAVAMGADPVEEVRADKTALTVADAIEEFRTYP